MIVFRMIDTMAAEMRQVRFWIIIFFMLLVIAVVALAGVTAYQEQQIQDLLLNCN